MEPLFQELLKLLRQISTVQFLTEGAHGSGGWPALAQSTIDKKKAAGQSPWIERASEDLFNSLTGDGRGSIADVSSDWLRYGTSIPYAGFQQSGTRHMPQRRLVQLTEEERKEFVRVVQRFLVTGEI